MSLCTCNQQPTLLIVQRSERVKHGNFLYSQIIFPAFEPGEKGDTEMKTADCTPNATNLFLSKEKLSYFSPYSELNGCDVEFQFSLLFIFDT